MNKAKGFTLIELVIVIVIVGILSVVAVPIYEGYTKKAIATEGKALLGIINTGQKVYYSEFSNFLNEGQKAVLDINAATNKYFTAYTLTATATTFTATTSGAAGTGATGINLTIIGSSTGASTIMDNL